MVLMILPFSCACVSRIDGANPDVRRSYPWLIYVDMYVVDVFGLLLIIIFCPQMVV